MVQPLETTAGATYPTTDGRKEDGSSDNQKNALVRDQRLGLF